MEQEATPDNDATTALLLEQRPDDAAQADVHVGTWVKVGLAGERFWCKVTGMPGGDELLVVVCNDLVKWPCRQGDNIVLQRNNVLETAELIDVSTFRGLVARHGVIEGSAVWRDLRMTDGVAVQPKDGTVFYVPGYSPA